MDTWLADPTIRVTHCRHSRACPADLWHAGRGVRIADTQLLGRLVRWRIPGTQARLTFDELFRHSPFIVLEEGPCVLVSGMVGRIWTLRRDYPQLGNPEEFRAWSRRGTARVLFATWAHSREDGGGILCSEVRVEVFGAQGRIGLATVRPLVRGFHHLIGAEGIAAAVRAAERASRP